MKDLYPALTEAADRVRETRKPGDRGKWSRYRRLSKAEQLEWRKREGHAEFCRLQRLDFHRHI